MNRKILQVGPATLAVSLPTNWIKKFNLKKGQDIVVEEEGNSLRIKTTNPIEEESSKINISLLHPVSTKIIGVLYKAGYKKIKVNYVPNKIVIHRGKKIRELDMIKNTFDHLIGMQFWELGKEKGQNYAITIESAKVDPKEFKNVLNKLCLNVIDQAETVHEQILENKDNIDEIYLNERLINQTTDFCIKILVSFGHEEYKKIIIYYDFICKLESIGDKYFQIALNYCKNKEKIDKNNQVYLEKAKNFIKEIILLYKKFDLDKTIISNKKIYETIEEYENKIKENIIKSNLISYNIYSILVELSETIEILYFLNHEYFKEKIC